MGEESSDANSSLFPPAAAPEGDISTPQLITPAHQAAARSDLPGNKQDLSCRLE